MKPKKTFKFNVPMIPVSKARARQGKFGWYTPKKTVMGESFVQVFSREVSHQFPHLQGVFTGIVGMDMHFHLPFHSALKKTEKIEGIPHIKIPDLDNMAKLVMDALNKVLYKDDGQVAFLKLEKSQSSKPRTEVTISYY